MIFECPICGSDSCFKRGVHDGVMGPGGYYQITHLVCSRCSAMFEDISKFKRKKNLVKFKKLSPNAIIPQYATSGSSGFDFHCIYDAIINPLETKLVSTGLTCSIPKDTELQVRAKSGLAVNILGYLIKNGIGTVDEDYRGEIMIPIHNMSHTQPIFFKAGNRIAQGIICPVIRCQIEEVEELDDTERGSGGFGSTGT